MNKSAVFSDDKKFRYALVRVWDETLPKAMCIGLNPSTADEVEDDTTITNLVKLLSDRGYGGLHMCNLFGLVSSEPEDLRRCPDPVGQNDYWMDVSARECDDVIFCWGSFKQAEYRTKVVIKKFPGALCLGKTTKGKPLHPLAATIWMKSKCKLQKF